MADDRTVIKLDMDTSPAENSLSQLKKSMEIIMRSSGTSSSMKSLTNQIYKAIRTTEELEKRINEALTKKYTTKAFDDATKKAQELKASVDDYVTRYLKNEAKVADTPLSRKTAEDFLAGTTSAKFANVRRAIEKYRAAEAEVQRLKESGEAFYIDTSSVEDLRTKLSDAYDRVGMLTTKFRETTSETTSLSDRVRRVASVMRTWNIITNTLHKGTTFLQNTYNKLYGAIKKCLAPLKALRKESEKHSASASNGFKGLLRNIMRYGLGIRSLYFLFKKLRQIAIEAIGEIAKIDADTNKQVSSVVQAFNQLKGSIGSMIQPLISVFAPALTKLLNFLSRVAQTIGALFAMITGKKVMIATANEVDYAKSLDKTSGSAKKAKKALEGYLSPIDELNKYKDKDGDDDDGVGYSFGKDGSPVDPESLLPDWLKRFLEPLKKAWAKVGEFVKSAWAKAFKSLKTLWDDIFNDFLDVWNEDATVEMLETMLRIFGRIGSIIDIIATKLDIAWNKNETGKRILEAIRDIFKIIVDEIDKALAYTEVWAMQLDFSPLLESFLEFLEALKPLVQDIMEVLRTFYTDVLLPLAKWALEKGLPELIGVFSDLATTLAESGLSEKLQELWKHLEPFAETVGEGLIEFIRQLAEKIGSWVTSDGFSSFIDKLGEWMDNVTKEDVVNTLWKIVGVLVGLKAAILGFKALEAIAGVLKTIQIFISFFAGATVATATVAISELALAISALVVAIQAIKDIGAYKKAIGHDTLLGALFDFSEEATQKKQAYAATKGSNPYRKKGEEIGEEISAGIGEGMEAHDFTSTANTTKANVSNSLESSFEIHSPAKTMYPIGNNIFLGIIEGFKEKFKEFTEAITEFYNTKVLPWSKPDKWTFPSIKKGLSDSFNAAIDKVKEIWNRFADWLNEKLQINIDTSTIIGKGLSSLLGTSTLNIGHIPHLAQGAVIPPNREFMAMLGDQRSGTNIETPLSTMIEAFNTALNNRGGAEKTEITFVLPNRQQVAQYVIEGGRILQTSRGSNPFSLA